jgi:gliding motility-associated-like protein
VSTPQGCNSIPVTNSLTVTPAPHINAGADKFITKGASVTMDASISNPSNYNYVWSPATFLDNAAILNPVCTPDTSVMYVVTATDKLSNCSDKDSVWVRIIYDLYVPNAFSPNGDGKNDVWGIPGMALYPEGKVTIFNRWGQIVYSTKNYQSHPWDGTLKGKALPDETFVYMIELPGKKKL